MVSWQVLALAPVVCRGGETCFLVWEGSWDLVPGGGKGLLTPHAVEGWCPSWSVPLLPRNTARYRFPDGLGLGDTAWTSWPSLLQPAASPSSVWCGAHVCGVLGTVRRRPSLPAGGSHAGGGDRGWERVECGGSPGMCRLVPQGKVARQLGGWVRPPGWGWGSRG